MRYSRRKNTISQHSFPSSKEAGTGGYGLVSKRFLCAKEETMFLCINAQKNTGFAAMWMSQSLNVNGVLWFLGFLFSFYCCVVLFIFYFHIMTPVLPFNFFLFSIFFWFYILSFLFLLFFIFIFFSFSFIFHFSHIFFNFSSFVILLCICVMSKSKS